MACLDTFSHVVECVFLLQQDNVICQALLDLCGESGNQCTICALPTVPLDTLTVTYSGYLLHNPSLMHTRIGIHSSETCMTIATTKLPGLTITSLISPHLTLTAIAFIYLIIMIGHPQCSHYDTALMLLHVIECSNDGEESGVLNSPEHLSLEPHYIHDEMSDASAEMMDMAVDSKIMIFSPTEKALAMSLETPWHQHKP
jgi:hypothetical protein